MASRRWALTIALLGLALIGSLASLGAFATRGRTEVAEFAIRLPVQHDGLVPIGPPEGALTAITRSEHQSLSKVLAAIVVVFAAIVVAAPRSRRLFLPRPITDTPGPSIRRRGPPKACFSASI